MDKSVLWRQLKAVLDNLSAALKGVTAKVNKVAKDAGETAEALSRTANIVKQPSEANQMLVTDANGESKWIERTHYDDFEMETYFDHFEVRGGNSKFAYVGSMIPAVGVEYDVVFDDVPYKCTAMQGASGDVYIGNGEIIEENGGNGEPFCFRLSGSTDLYLEMSENIQTRIVSISALVDKPKKIDPKYLPIQQMNLENGQKFGAIKGLETQENAGEFSFQFGRSSAAGGDYATAFGENALASGRAAFATGSTSSASGSNAFASGYRTSASGVYSHAEGYTAYAAGQAAHAEGLSTCAYGNGSHAEGRAETKTITITGSAYATSFTVNSGVNDVAVGDILEYLGHVARVKTKSGSTITLDTNLWPNALSKKSVTVRPSSAAGIASHAEGMNCSASGNYSHAEGSRTKASGDTQHVQGKYNVEDAAGTYAHIVGNGTSDNNRKNAHTIDWNGNAWFSGKVFVGGNSMDDGATELGAGGGGEYTPPDWGTKRENGYLMPETTLAVDPDVGSAAYAPVIDVVAGEQYTVKWNGTDYVCNADAIDLNGLPVVALGNHGAVTGGESTNEPFVIATVSGDTADMLGAGVIIMPLDGSMSPVVSIYGDMEVVRKIEEKFLSFSGFPTINLMDYGLTEIVSQTIGEVAQLTEEQAEEVEKAFKAGTFWCITGGIENVDVNAGAKALLNVGVLAFNGTMCARAIVELSSSYANFMEVVYDNSDKSLYARITRLQP